MGGILVLEDGLTFEGEAWGADATVVGEVVFNTAMTGYQEVLSDPSYREQLVVMTVPHVGNYGINDDDLESGRIQAAGFVVRELSRVYANHRGTDGLHPWLRREGVPAIQRIDTRALVRHVREKGAMRAAVSTDGTTRDELLERIRAWPGMAGRALAHEVSCKAPYLFAGPEAPILRLSVLDGGCKASILRLLASAGCRVMVWPAATLAGDLLDGADAVFVSNGPGDPAALPGMVETLQGCLGKAPLLGICLGHQLLGRALGADTFKLRFGHRGANHPVRDEESGKVLITSQNHGFAVAPAGLKGARVTLTSLYDGTLEGFVHDDLRVMTAQFHPEAAPGPHDARGLLVDRFIEFVRA